MENLTIPLSPRLKEFVVAQAAAGGFGNPGEYVQAVLDKERERARAKVEALMDEALASGEATELTKQDFENIRQQFRARHAERLGNSR